MKREIRAIQAKLPESYKGKVYEDFFVWALEELLEEGKILGFKRSRQNGDDDSNGIDFYIYCRHGKQIPIQVTSTPEMKFKHQLRRSHIPVISIVNPSSKNTLNLDTIKKDIMRLIEDHVGVGT